jgi:hypothetical protein
MSIYPKVLYDWLLSTNRTSNYLDSEKDESHEFGQR